MIWNIKKVATLSVIFIIAFALYVLQNSNKISSVNVYKNLAATNPGGVKKDDPKKETNTGLASLLDDKDAEKEPNTGQEKIVDIDSKGKKTVKVVGGCKKGDEECIKKNKNKCEIATFKCPDGDKASCINKTKSCTTTSAAKDMPTCKELKENVGRPDAPGVCGGVADKVVENSLNEQSVKDTNLPEGSSIKDGEPTDFESEYKVGNKSDENSITKMKDNPKIDIKKTDMENYIDNIEDKSERDRILRLENKRKLAGDELSASELNKSEEVRQRAEKWVDDLRNKTQAVQGLSEAKNAARAFREGTYVTENEFADLHSFIVNGGEIEGVKVSYTSDGLTKIIEVDGKRYKMTAAVSGKKYVSQVDLSPSENPGYSAPKAPAKSPLRGNGTFNNHAPSNHQTIVSTGKTNPLPQRETWNNQTPKIATTRGETNPYADSYFTSKTSGQSPAYSKTINNQNSFGRMVNSMFNPSYSSAPQRPASEASGRRNSNSLGPVAFNDIGNVLYKLGYTGNDEPTYKQKREQPTPVELSDITMHTNEFGEVIAYGVSKEQLKKILKDITGRNVTEQSKSLPTISTDDSGRLLVEEVKKSDNENTAPQTPSWLRDFVSTGAKARVDSSGYYGYVTSSDNSTVDIYDKKDGKFVTVKAKEDGVVTVGLQNKEGKTVFLPTGGVLDAEAQWGEFTNAFVDIAGREPEQTLETQVIPLSPYDIAVREIYGEDALEFGVPFATNDPAFTVGKNGELIPAAVIDAAMEVVKERLGVNNLQREIEVASDGKIDISTRASDFPINVGVGAQDVRIMPAQQQMLVLARIKGEMAARGHGNITAQIRTAIFNSYDSTAKKVAGVVAFTTRIDEAGNQIGSAKVTFSLGTLVTELFATFVGTSNDSLANGTLTKFFGSFFRSSTPQQDGNVYRVQDDSVVGDYTSEPRTFGEAAAKIVGKVIAAPFKVIGSVFGGLFK